VRVAVNGLFWGRETTGSGQYIHNLLRALLNATDEVEYLLVVPRSASVGASLVGLSEQGLQVLESRTPLDGLNDDLAKVWFEQVSFPAVCRRWGAHLAFVPYFAPPLFCPVPVVVTIHDLIPLILPAYRGSAGVRAYMRLVSRAARRADVILTDSAASQRDVERLLDVPSGRIRVVYLAASRAYRRRGESEQVRVRSLYRLPSRYLLYFGGFDVRKNVEQVVETYARARRLPGFPDDVWLVVAGRLPPRSTSFNPDPRPVAAALGVAERVRFTGWVEESDKPALYSGATAFVFPSRYEGFGLPVLEAMSCGVPVIVSDAGSLPEVVGNAGLIVPAGEVSALAQAVADVVRDEDLRARLGRRAAVRAREFSWERAAAETLESFRDAMRGAAPL